MENQQFGGGGEGGIIQGIIGLAILLVIIIAMWRVFTKAGQPGWAVLIPIYNATYSAKSRANRAGGSC